MILPALLAQLEYRDRIWKGTDAVFHFTFYLSLLTPQRKRR
jgi:hypothetical protein